MTYKSRQIEIKVILGYLLFFAISAIALVFTYQQITRLAQPETHSYQSSTKMVMVGQALTNLLEAETQGQAFLQGGDTKTLNNYLSLMGHLNARIDTLTRFTNDSVQRARIDTIELLLNLKIKNMVAINKIRRSQHSGDFYEKAIQAIEAVEDSIQEVHRVRRQETTVRDSTFVKQDKKKGLFGNLFARKSDSALQVTISHHTTVDTIVSRMAVAPSLQTKEALMAALHHEQLNDKKAAAQIKQRETLIMDQSNEITLQLRRILTDFEHEELARAVNQMAQKEEVIAKTSRFFAGLGVGAASLTLLLLFLILRDLTLSNRYRQQLEASNEYANKLLKSRETLLQSVTHDIKSPLGAIMGFIEIMGMTTQDDKQKYYLGHMKNSSDYILHLVNNLLDLSKLENHKMPVETVDFTPKVLVEEVFHGFMAQAQLRNLQLICHAGADLAQVWQGDALKIKQILHNLVSNAVKYTPKGSVEIHASSSLSNDALILKVTDTGMGMTPTERAKLFDEFTRFASGKGIEGTGLGMTITLKLIELLGGTIQVESEVGKGTRVVVQIPVKPNRTTATRPEAPEHPTLPVATEDGAKILLIDDDAVQLQMAIAALQKYGVEAEGTDNVDNLMDALLQHKACMVFTDIQMPGISGIELLHRIRQSNDPYVNQLPVVALSAATVLSEADYRAEGFDAFLGKPYTPKQLVGMVARFCKHVLPIDVAEPELAQPDKAYSVESIIYFADGDVESVHRIISAFEADLQNYYNDLSTFLNSGDSKSLMRVAHKMLPMFKQVGAVRALPHLSALEDNAKNPLTESQIRLHVDAVLHECVKLGQWLSHYSD